MSGVRKAATLAVCRQIAGLFTAAAHPEGPLRRSSAAAAPAGKHWCEGDADCGGPGKGAPASFKVGEPMVGKKPADYGTGCSYLPGLGHCQKCSSAQDKRTCLE